MAFGESPRTAVGLPAVSEANAACVTTVVKPAELVIFLSGVAQVFPVVRIHEGRHSGRVNLR